MNTAVAASAGQHASLCEVRVVVPTYNAEPHWPDLQDSLERQGISPDHVLIVDSSSKDATAALAIRAGYRLLTIPQEEFGHGATRQMAADYLPEADLLVFLTQDATLEDPAALARLCEALEDPEVGAAYGRQAPRSAAEAIERHARVFNYPDRSHVMTFGSRERYGIKAAFCSNSFAAYRRSALVAVGGFPTDVILAEDSVVAARLLMAGWKVAYQASAVAIHSHPLSLRQEFSRYFDTGVHHSRESWLLETFGAAYGEGGSFLQSELRYLLRQAPWLIPISLVRTCSKLAGYRLGQLERLLPLTLVCKLSGYPTFFSRRVKATSAHARTASLPPTGNAYGSSTGELVGVASGRAVSGRPIDSSVST